MTPFQTGKGLLFVGVTSFLLFLVLRSALSRWKLAESARIQSEVLLDEGQERMRSILDGMFALVGLLNTEGVLLEVNRAPLEAAGLQEDDVLNRPLAEAYWWAHSQSCQDRLNRAIGRARSGELVREDFQARLAEGRNVTLDTHFSALRGDSGEIVQLVVTGVDVTERKLAEDALRHSEERFRQVVENIREVFWMTDPTKGQMLYISPGYEAIWGRPAGSLYHNPGLWLDAIVPEDRARVKMAAMTRQVSGDYDIEYRVQRPDGEVRWIRDRAFPITNAEGEVYRVAGVAEDVTDHKQLEAQLRQSQKMDAIGQLASGVAHDFNNLLTVIQGNASLLLGENATRAELEEYTREIVLASERAAVLTRQMLLFSRKQEMQRTTVDLNEIVQDLVRMLQRMVGEQITIKANCPPELPTFLADAGMIEQVLLNLVVNARDAMPEGGKIQISTGLTQVAGKGKPKSTVAPGAYVTLRVQDSGVGIAPEILPRVFEPFFTTKESGKGTGLGLATVYAIVNQHGGWIDIETVVGKGTIFMVALPTTTAPALARQEVLPEGRPPGGSETLLVVEDDEALRLLVTGFLQRCGYTVLDAASGVRALKLWEQHRDTIQLLLTDVVLPDGMSGQDLAIRFQADKPSLKVIYSSGYDISAKGGKSSRIDESNFLHKPYHTHKLATLVREQLDHG